MNSTHPSSGRYHVAAQRTERAGSLGNKWERIVAATAGALDSLFGGDKSLVPIPVKAGPARRPNPRRSRD
jgi:hypothetical protein